MKLDDVVKPLAVPARCAAPGDGRCTEAEMVKAIRAGMDPQAAYLLHRVF